MTADQIAGGGNELLDAALAYAAENRPVFPCKPDKSPYTTNGFRDACCDPDQIKQWWIRWPDAMIGAPVPDGQVCLDMDPRHGAELGDLFDELPDTRTVWSGRGDGGRHFYFNRPDCDLTQTRLPKGWDLRDANKHYLVMPPSPHPETGKQYQWDGTATTRLGDLPPRVVALLRKETPAPKPAPAPVPALAANAGTSGGAISDYNARTTISSILIRHGWQLVKGDGDSDGSEWRHPTATAAISATVRGSRLYNYSTNTGFPLAGPREGGQSPFDVHTHLDHGGNEVAALDAIRGNVALPPIAWPTATNVAPVIDPSTVEEFWAARPELARIWTFARARRVSPWAVLGVNLARLAAAVPPWVVLPPLVGGVASLNLFVNLVSASGGGKGTAEAAAGDCLDVGTTVDTAGVGSGEGLVHLFLRRTKEGVDQHRTAVIMSAAEIDTLAAVGARQGSTLLPELRKAWSGEGLGFAYADPAKALPLKAHQYRLCLIAGVQPTRAQWVLDDAGGGTPQRFLWLPADDPDAPDSAPVPPDPITWRAPAYGTAQYTDGRVHLPVCETARSVIDANRLARLRGHGDALDGHALLGRLKVAAVLGLLDGHAGVRDSDWELAGVIAAVSDSTRAGVVEVLRAEAALRNRSKAEAEGARAVIVGEAVETAALVRVCRAIVRKLHGGPMTGGEVRRVLASRDRGGVEEALQRLIDAGQIVAETAAYQGQNGVRYSLARESA